MSWVGAHIKDNDGMWGFGLMLLDPEHREKCLAAKVTPPFVQAL
jgi:hypothetical protein